MPESASPVPPMWAPRSQDGALLPLDSNMPPTPPGCRYVRVKWLGIVVADDDLRRRVDRFFHAPMIVLALLVLPLLMLDYSLVREGGANGEVTRGWLWWLVLGGLTLIWIAFTIEFVVKIAIAENRIEYLRRNWLDLIIIIIPLLRPLRVAALARTSQAFRLRGVGFKFARYAFTLFIGLEATNRLMHRMGMKPRKQRPDPETMTRHELSVEVTRLRKLSDDWSAWYANQRQYLASTGHSPLPPVHPSEVASPSACEQTAASTPLIDGEI